MIESEWPLYDVYDLCIKLYGFDSELLKLKIDGLKGRTERPLSTFGVRTLLTSEVWTVHVE